MDSIIGYQLEQLINKDVPTDGRERDEEREAQIDSIVFSFY